MEVNSMNQSVSSDSAKGVEPLLVQARTQIMKYLPRHLDADKMIYVALETVRSDSFLRQCEPLSIVQAVLEASQLGLMLGNKLGHAYLVPRREKKANNILKCQLLIGYRGFIALAHRTGKVSSIYPAIVHSGDQFSLKLGTGRQLIHTPVLNPAKRGEWIGAYAVVEFRDGRTDFEWMTRQEIEKVKLCSDSATEAWSPWRRFEDEMIKKSPIRRMAKRLCLSSEDMTLVEAAVRDEYREMGVEEAQTILPATEGAQRSLPAAGSNGRGNRTARPPIREPQRKADSQPNNGHGSGQAKPGDATSNQATAGSGTNGTAPPNGTQSKPITLRGVIGPIEADASGSAIRHNGNGVEYVVFKIAHNGSATTVYSKRPEMVSEIARRQGREATVRLAIVTDQSRGYHVLEGFTEG
jgi:recombination protein RecT